MEDLPIIQKTYDLIKWYGEHPTFANVCVIPTKVGIYIEAKYLWISVCTGMTDRVAQ
jgi:hypothetical protein